MVDDTIHNEDQDISAEETPIEQVSTETEDYAALMDKYQRLQAEFINYKNRTEQEKRDYATFANKGLILGLLPVADSLHSAQKSIPAEIADHTWMTGFQQFAKQMYSFFESQEVSRMEIVEGETAFDPELHEAIASEESEGKEGIILESYQDGYLLKDKVLRNAKVKVGA